MDEDRPRHQHAVPCFTLYGTDPDDLCQCDGHVLHGRELLDRFHGLVESLLPGWASRRLRAGHVRDVLESRPHAFLRITVYAGWALIFHLLFQRTTSLSFVCRQGSEVK